MQVHELIRILMEMPQDARVILNLERNEMANGCEAKEVSAMTLTRWKSQERSDGEFQIYSEYIHDNEFNNGDFTAPEQAVIIRS